MAISCVFAMLAPLGLPAVIAQASDGMGSATGLDLSWPQCKSGIPTPLAGSTFAIVGVTGGRTFTHNPCFAAEYRWAIGRGFVTSLYLNLNAPPRAMANPGQAAPAGSCARSDRWCAAFNYGYHVAQDALAYAVANQASAATWWLDVETMNYWSDDVTVNAQVIAGAIQFFDDHHLAVGIYSVPRMWCEIAGVADFGRTIWIAKENHDALTMSYCAPTNSFAGGTIQMVQMWNGHFDVDRPCPERIPALASTGADGSALAPFPLNERADGTLASSEGGQSVYYTLANEVPGTQQTLTISFGSLGPDISSGLFVTVYQRGSPLRDYHAIDATTPGLVSLTLSSDRRDPFVIRLANYNSPSATPVQFIVSRSST